MDAPALRRWQVDFGNNHGQQFTGADEKAVRREAARIYGADYPIVSIVELKD